MTMVKGSPLLTGQTVNWWLATGMAEQYKPWPKSWSIWVKIHGQIVFQRWQLILRPLVQRTEQNRNVQIKYKKETGHQQRRSNHTYASALGMCVHYLPLISLQIKLSLCMAIEFSLCANI